MVGRIRSPADRCSLLSNLEGFAGNVRPPGKRETLARDSPMPRWNRREVSGLPVYFYIFLLKTPNTRNTLNDDTGESAGQAGQGKYHISNRISERAWIYIARMLQQNDVTLSRFRGNINALGEREREREREERIACGISHALLAAERYL